MRRYIPAAAFPLTFVLISSVWFGLKNLDRKKISGWALLGGAVFSLLVYSYFFIWTAMFGWLFCIALMCFLFQSENRKRQILNFWLPFVSVVLISAIPYFLLVKGRSKTTDAAQILEKTRSVVLLRPTLILGLLVLLAAFGFIKSSYLDIKNQITLFIISFSFFAAFCLQSANSDRLFITADAL